MNGPLAGECTCLLAHAALWVAGGMAYPPGRAPPVWRPGVTPAGRGGVPGAPRPRTPPPPSRPRREAGSGGAPSDLRLTRPRPSSTVAKQGNHTENRGPRVEGDVMSQTYDRRRQDVGNIVTLEHVNVRI